MSLATPRISHVLRPESTPALSEIAERLLSKAGVADRLPTPIEDLIESAELASPEDPQPFLERFLGRLSPAVRESFQRTWQKIRGIADLRERAIYIPAEPKEHRRRFVQAHELGHQVIPWHRVNTAYRDDNQSLKLIDDAQELFDIEANFFAAEVIFQGRRFTRRARDYRPSFDAAFLLANEHGASRHATLWRLIQEQDETLALLTYWPSRYTFDGEGYPTLRGGKGVASEKFREQYHTLKIPESLTTGHPWVAARDLGSVCDGEISLACNASSVLFQWQSWWNTYTLFVLLRRKPILSVVRRLITKTPMGLADPGFG